MNPKQLPLTELHIEPVWTNLYIPPIVWKGDHTGHIGGRDTFFWVLEGECFLTIDSQYFIIRPGQLAYLPKGKMRAYTQASSSFTKYELGFCATSHGQNVMELLGFTSSNYVVTIPQKEEMSSLFEKCSRVEMNKDPIYAMECYSNMIRILCLYAEARRKQNTSESAFFSPVLHYMAKNLNRLITAEELAALVYMQPTYFSRRFKEIYGMPPMTYLAHLRLYRAMELLVSTNYSMEQVATAVGMEDSSYFSRFFKKNCGVTPSEYRNTFQRD
jgi:YesN/AraC family two-component response regulator